MQARFQNADRRRAYPLPQRTLLVCCRRRRTAISSVTERDKWIGIRRRTEVVQGDVFRAAWRHVMWRLQLSTGRKTTTTTGSGEVSGPTTSRSADDVDLHSKSRNRTVVG